MSAAIPPSHPSSGPPLGRRIEPASSSRRGGPVRAAQRFGAVRDEDGCGAQCATSPPDAAQYLQGGFRLFRSAERTAAFASLALTVWWASCSGDPTSVPSAEWVREERPDVSSRGCVAFVARAADGSRTVVVDDGEGGGRELSAGEDPAWSTAGDSIAFVRGGAVWIADVESGVARECCVGDLPRWLPDRADSLLVVRSGAQRGIWIVSWRDGSGRSLWLYATMPDGNDAGDVVFVRPDGMGSNDLWVASLQDPRNERRLTAGEDLREPRWSPDGEQVLAADLRRGGLSTVAKDGRIVNLAFTGESKLTQYPVGDWMADGGRVMYTREVLWVSELNGSSNQIWR